MNDNYKTRINEMIGEMKIYTQKVAEAQAEIEKIRQYCLEFLAEYKDTVKYVIEVSKKTGIKCFGTKESMTIEVRRDDYATAIYQGEPIYRGVVLLKDAMSLDAIEKVKTELKNKTDLSLGGWNLIVGEIEVSKMYMKYMFEAVQNTLEKRVSELKADFEMGMKIASKAFFSESKC